MLKQIQSRWSLLAYLPESMAGSLCRSKLYQHVGRKRGGYELLYEAAIAAAVVTVLLLILLV